MISNRIEDSLLQHKAVLESIAKSIHEKRVYIDSYGHTLDSNSIFMQLPDVYDN